MRKKVRPRKVASGLTRAALRPRKAPTKDSAQNTVALILQATVLMLEEVGYSKMTTNKIAARAGVSIGSLYQYFPNRDAIVMTLYENTSSAVAQALRMRMVEVVDSDPKVGIPQMIALLLELYEHHQLILLRSVERIPHLRTAAQAISVDNLIHSTTRTYLEQNVTEFTFIKPEWTMFIVESVLLSTIRNYILKRPVEMSPQDFVNELSRLVLGYVLNSGKKKR